MKVANLPTMSSHQDDESSGEIHFNPPLPIHERTWRHPSEIDLPSAPISLGRKTARNLAVATAAMSVVLSIVLAAVLLPSRPEPNQTITFKFVAESPADDPFGLDVDASKFGYLAGTDVAVAAMTSSGFLLTTLTEVAPGEIVQIRAIDGSLVESIVVAHETDLGVTWLHEIDGASGEHVPLGEALNIPNKQIVVLQRGNQVWVQASPSDVRTAQIGVSTDSNQRLVPIEPEPNSVDIVRGPAFDDEGNLIGWCVRRNGGVWMVPLALIEERLLRLESSVE